MLWIRHKVLNLGSISSSPVTRNFESPKMPDNGKLSNLPQLHKFYTGHNKEGKAIVQEDADYTWQPYDDQNMAFSVVYSTSNFPADLNKDEDLNAHKKLMSEGRFGLVNPNGTILRCVDFAPGYACQMHRTQSLDYGIVLEGDIEMVLDSGDKVQMKRGDVAVQRGTNHQWVNTHPTNWARMMFVLQDCKPLNLDGQTLQEELGGMGGVLSSKRSD